MRAYIGYIEINKVRHLRDIKIQLPDGKHLIFTGKNGSGKTSILENLRNFLNKYITYNKEEVHIDISGKKVINRRRFIPCEGMDLFVGISQSDEVWKKAGKGEFIIAY